MIELENQSPVPFAPLFLDHHELFVVLDLEDHAWAMQWQWVAKPSKQGPTRKLKFYAYRIVRDRMIHGVRFRKSVYLHKAICQRAYGPPPTPLHIIADHTTGNTWDCRREKLRWATRSENRLNIDGAHDRQMRMALS